MIENTDEKIKAREEKIQDIIQYLKDCPFCGSQTIWYREKGWRNTRIGYVQCDICGAQTKAVECYMNWDIEACEKVMDKWNTRCSKVAEHERSD